MERHTFRSVGLDSIFCQCGARALDPIHNFEAAATEHNTEARCIKCGHLESARAKGRCAIWACCCSCVFPNTQSPEVCAQCEANARSNEAGGYTELAAECRAYCLRGHIELQGDKEEGDSSVDEEGEGEMRAKAPCLSESVVSKDSSESAAQPFPMHYCSVGRVHRETVARWFVDLVHYWFDESLGANLFTGMREDAERYLSVWVKTGDFAADITTLEIHVRTKFEEWLKLSWEPWEPWEQPSTSDVLISPERGIGARPETEISESYSATSPDTAGELPERIWYSAPNYACTRSGCTSTHDGEYARVHPRSKGGEGELLTCPFCGEQAQELGMFGKSLVRHYPHTDWMTPVQWNTRTPSQVELSTPSDVDQFLLRLAAQDCQHLAAQMNGDCTEELAVADWCVVCQAREILQKYSRAPQVEGEAAWRPIGEAPRDATPMIVALIDNGQIWRAAYAKFYGVGFYSVHDGESCHWATHFMIPPLPQSKQKG